MLSKSFLTLPDDRVKPTGSRDPLGFQTIWVNLGREIVGDNLTTITTSIDNFIITLLACHYAFKEPVDKKMETFFKVEQLGAYFRIASKHTSNIMGITKAVNNFDNEIIKLGSSKEAQIFSNQKTSGLWGYYSSALMMTTLINKDKSRLTEVGENLINTFMKNFALDDLVKLNEIPKTGIKNNAEKFISAMKSLYTEMEKLVLNRSKYKIYSKYAQSFFKASKSGYKEFYTWLNDNHDDQELTIRLNEIKKIDEVLWLASTIFDYCRTQKGKTVEEVADEISKSLLINIQLNQSNTKIDKFVELWNVKNIEKAIKELIELHSNAMKGRKSANWLSIKENKINVTVHKKMSLPVSIEFIPWQYDYFLHSYLSIAYQVSSFSTKDK